MARRTSMAYNKDTKKWEAKKSDNKKDSESPKTGDKGKGNGGKNKSTATDSRTAKGKAEQKKNKADYYTMSGTLKVMPNQHTIKIKCHDTVDLKNLGSFLSGKYYVATVTRTIDSNGYSQDIEVYNPEFRDRFKVRSTSDKELAGNEGSGDSQAASNGAKKRRAVSTSAEVLSSTKEEGVDDRNVRTYTISSPSDTLWTLAKRFYGDTSRWRDIYLLSTGETPDPLNLKIGMKVVIP